jgi:uncharacterized protein
LNVYFDTSVLVSLFIEDDHTERAKQFVRSHSPIATVSDFAAAEYASAVSRLVRVGLLGLEAALASLDSLDQWRADETTELLIEPGDVASAASLVRRMDSSLRTPDAIHLAMARRSGALLATFDHALAGIAQRLGLETAGA